MKPSELERLDLDHELIVSLIQIELNKHENKALIVSGVSAIALTALSVATTLFLVGFL